LYVDDMYNIIRPYADSEADIIFFKERSVLSTDIHQIIKRVEYMNKYIDEYFETGCEKFVRLRYPQPWGKMIKREFVENYRFRFDEVEYSNDRFFSVCTGYYANEIDVPKQVLYIYTYRKNSLAGVFCSKPNELKVRAEVAFRSEKMFRQLNVGIEPHRPFKWYLYRMLHQDRDLFRYYFFRLPEIYPSIPAAIQSLCSGKGMKFTIKLYLYSFWLWIR